MNPAQQLHQLGQRLWLDNITRTLLDDGTLARYIDTFAVSGLTSNPAIFEQAVKHSAAYDAAIRQGSRAGHAPEAVFFDLALDDLTRAAALFLPQHRASSGLDGWVSLEVSPLLARDAAATLTQAKNLHARAACPNLFIKIPGSAEGAEAIEEAIFAGVPVNVTLLFSCAHYRAAAYAYVRGLERRAAAGLSLDVASVASLFVSRWDAAANAHLADAAASAHLPDAAASTHLPDAAAHPLRNRLGIAVATRTWHAHQHLLASPRWQALAVQGARPQRLLWASTGAKDPAISASYYVEALALPGTVNTLPEKTLLAFAAGGVAREGRLLDAAGNAQVLDEFRRAGVEEEVLAQQLQSAGISAFATSWASLIDCIATKG